MYENDFFVFLLLILTLKSKIMKKIFTFIFAIALSLNMLAQCPITTAVDFTATDCHGTEVHLFDILDGGQYVLIDFFFTTCGPCQQATPKIVESYYAMGCNMHDVYYMEISPSDADAACQTWAANYGVEYPTIGTAGGGNTICNTYQISYYPTVILIAPDRSIVMNDLWPINNAQTVISALEAQGVQQHDCTAPAGVVELSADTVYINSADPLEPGLVTIINKTNEDVQINGYMSEDFKLTDEGFGCFNNGMDILGMVIAPNESLDVEIYTYPFEVQPEVVGNMVFATSYGSLELTIYWVNVLSVNEISENNFVIYPNPAKDFLKINGENLGNVSVYNAMGQIVAEYFAENELNINVANLVNGVYFVKIGEKTQRFVVTH